MTRSPAQTFTPSSLPVPVLTGHHAAREPRWSHRAPCVLRLLNTSGQTTLEVRGETVNMSASGLAVLVSEPVPTGLFVETVIAHKGNGEALIVRGRIVHSRCTLAGSFELGVRAEVLN